LLETSAGSISLQREVGRPAGIVLELAGGAVAELTDSEFQQLIGGVDEPTFRTVFAFSLAELGDLSGLSGEQVRARIFGAGVGGAGPSAAQVVRGLEAKCQALLKPRSQTAGINAAFAGLAQCESELREARLRCEEYPSLIEQQLAAQEGLQTIDEAERRLRAAQAKCERLQELWPVWVELEARRDELDSLEPVDEFVPDAMRRLTEAKSELEQSHASFTRLKEQRERKDRELEGLQDGAIEGLSELVTPIENQLAQAPFYRSRISELQTAGGRLQSRQERLENTLRELGSSDDQHALSLADTSFGRFDEVRTWRSKLSDAAAQSRSALEKLESAAEQTKRAQAESNREWELLDSLPPAAGEQLTAQFEALRALRAGVAELRAKRAVLEGRLATMDAGPVFRTGFIVALGAVAIALVAAAVAATIGHARLLAVVLGGATLVVVVALAAISMAGRQSKSKTAQRAREEGALRAEIERMEAMLSEPAALLSLSNLPEPDEIENLDAVLATQAAEEQERHQQAAALSRAEDRLSDAQVNESIAADKLVRARDEEQSLQMQFRAVLASWGLSDSFTPEAADEYLRRVAVARELAADCREDQLLIARLEKEKVDWQNETMRLIRAAHRAVATKMGEAAEAGPDGSSEPLGTDETQVEPEIDPESLVSALAKLAEACRAEADLRRTALDIQNNKAELDGEMATLQARLLEAARVLQALFDRAGVPDEEEFLRRFSIFERRRQLKEKLSVAEEMLVTSIGRGDEAEQFRAQLALGEIASWQDRLERTVADLETVRAERTELTKIEGDLERRLAELEESADVPALEIGLEAARAELEELVERWRTYSLAGLLIKETLAQFTQERQPQVLAEASGMFDKVTQGRYTRIQRLNDEEDLVVADDDGRLKSPVELSRGTAEQLYLCLRLGLADEFARRAESVPLVMDDVLVNFDATRRRNTAQLLLECAERHQILLFTCHEETVHLLQQLDSDARVINL
jgi:uncharacterized protein YhaN